HPSLERVEELGTYSGLLVVARALILWRRDKHVIDVWDHPQPYVSVPQRREFQGYLDSVKGQNIRVPFALQYQNWTMNAAVDVRHIERQVLPEVFVPVGQFHVWLPCFGFPDHAAEHIDDGLFQTVIGRIHRPLHCKVVEHLFIEERLKIPQRSSSQQGNRGDLLVACRDYRGCESAFAVTDQS